MQEIREATMISDVELKRTLQSLACAKYKILNKEPRSKEINEKVAQFRFNESFTNPMSRIKIQTVTNKVENKLELKETSDRVEEDRRLHTEVGHPSTSADSPLLISSHTYAPRTHHCFLFFLSLGVHRQSHENPPAALVRRAECRGRQPTQ